jgi:hypothetical protein
MCGYLFCTRGAMRTSNSLTRIVTSQSPDLCNLSANNVELRPSAYALHSLYHPVIGGHQSGRETLTVHNQHWERK